MDAGGALSLAWTDLWCNRVDNRALTFQLLVRLELEGDRVVAEERLLQGVLGRIRDVREGPDGYLYLLSDAIDGRLARLEPLP
ncbi:MAG: PQQ-dependent sugar dehydrogenase [Candidatus Sedimenticola endophacoides]